MLTLRVVVLLSNNLFAQNQINGYILHLYGRFESNDWAQRISEGLKSFFLVYVLTVDFSV